MFVFLVSLLCLHVMIKKLFQLLNNKTVIHNFLDYRAKITCSLETYVAREISFTTLYQLDMGVLLLIFIHYPWENMKAEKQNTGSTVNTALSLTCLIKSK